MEIIGIFSTYSPIDRLILWHFPMQFMVFPSATITWNSGAGYMKKFKSLAILEWIKLWVLPESINTITFFFLIYPSIFIFWGLVTPTKALQDMVGVISSAVSCFFPSGISCSFSSSVSCSFYSSSSQSMENNFFSTNLCPLLYLLSQLKHRPFDLISAIFWGVKLVGLVKLEEGTLFSL